MTVEVWEGVYSTWDEAVGAAEGSPAVFDEIEWLQKVVEQLRDYREELVAYGVALPPRPSNLPLVCLLTAPKTIVDFGGSSAWCWEYVQAVLPRFQIKRYQVIETETIVSFFNGSGDHEPPVSYHTAVEEIESCDLFYANSVLQYFPSNDSLVELVSHLSPTHILLDDLFAGENPEFYSTQNYYGKKIPCRFINFAKLDQALTDIGYLLLSKMPFDSPTLGVSQPKPMMDFPTNHRLRYSISTLYERVR